MTSPPGSSRFSRPARVSASEGSENGGAMPATSSDQPPHGEPAARGRLAAAISTGVVHVFSEHTGRGPTHARTTIDGETVVVILQDGMTKAERSLADAGKEAEVLRLRRTFQDTMRVDLVALVERLTAANVHAFMSANHVAPDVAAEIFLLDRKVGAATE
jgi:uncharacterized protein YbcI